MSTITTLLARKTLGRVDMGLLDDEVPERGLFGTQRLFDFLGKTLPAISSQDAVLSAEEQVANLFGRYLKNRPLILNSPISPIRHLDHAIWELKTLDVRVFGWFCAKDFMVVDSGCDVKLLKSGKVNYSAFINQTEYVRTKLGFQPNEYIHGKQPVDILTNFTLIPRPKRSPLCGRR